MNNMNFDRIGDELAKAYEEGYQKGLEDGYEKGLEEQRLVDENCDDEGNCIPSTVLESFQEETWWE